MARTIRSTMVLLGSLLLLESTAVSSLKGT